MGRPVGLQYMIIVARMDHLGMLDSSNSILKGAQTSFLWLRHLVEPRTVASCQMRLCGRKKATVLPREMGHKTACVLRGNC